jgi:hypothetical protein
VIQWPIILTDLIVPTQISPGEDAFITFYIQNQSKKPVGNRVNKPVFVEIQCSDDFLQIDQSFLKMEIDLIHEMDQLYLKVPVKMKSTAVLFQRFNFFVRLHYKKRLIEYGEKTIRVSPQFDPLKKADSIFFSDSHLTFEAMQVLFPLYVFLKFIFVVDLVEHFRL